VSRRTVSNPPPADFLSLQDEANAFWRMRRRIVAALLQQAVAKAKFRLMLVLLLSALLWWGLFWLFAVGFDFLETGIRDPQMHDLAVRAVFGMFFAALMVMLIFSSGVILYGSLFRSPEVGYLLTIPARTGRVFLHKFQEAVVLSSWGFLLLGSPMLLAYGVVSGAPWYYYAMLMPFLVGFVYIPASIGAVSCLAIMYWVPGRRLHMLLLASAGVGVAVLVFAWSLTGIIQNELLTPNWFQEMLSRLQFTEERWLPSWWLSSGLLEASRHACSESVLFLTLILANALFGRQAAIWVAARLYRPAYSRLHGGPAAWKYPKLVWIERIGTWVDRIIVRITGFLAASLDRITLRIPFFLSRQIRLLLVKDLRLFRRDPVQWSQFLIFFALLALYFLNIRRFTYRDRYIGWVNVIAFLNLSVVGLLMSTFTTRFIYPMISLEGRRFWYLGLLPLRRETILWGKFAFAVGCSIIPCGGLILLSDYMLGVPSLIVASHQLTCLILCVGLSGIAVGFGARFPNLREQSPSRIAAGFGGTLNLVISTLYILVVVLLTALPSHFYLAARFAEANVGGFGRGAMPLEEKVRIWLFAGSAASILLGIIATVVPLAVGFRAFRRLEF